MSPPSARSCYEPSRREFCFVAQALHLLPVAMWFGIFGAVTGICNKEFAQLYMTRFVQSSLVDADARQDWRPEALLQLKKWLGQAWGDWMC